MLSIKRIGKSTTRRTTMVIIFTTWLARKLNAKDAIREEAISMGFVLAACLMIFGGLIAGIMVYERLKPRIEFLEKTNEELRKAATLAEVGEIFARHDEELAGIRRELGKSLEMEYTDELEED